MAKCRKSKRLNSVNNGAGVWRRPNENNIKYHGVTQLRRNKMAYQRGAETYGGAWRMKISSNG